MTYADLKNKLLADITDFLDNGFKQKIVAAVKDSMIPELKGLVVDLHTQALEARDGTCVHYRDMLQKHVDRKTEGLADRIGTLEMYMPQVRMLGDAVKALQIGLERQQVATAQLETTSKHLEKLGETLGGKVNGQAGKIDDLEDKPGRQALRAREKLKWAVISGLIALGVGTGGGILLMFLRAG